MGNVLKVVGAGAASLAVFGGSVAVFLMARGEMNAKGMRQLPVVGELFQQEPPPAIPVAGGEGPPPPGQRPAGARAPGAPAPGAPAPGAPATETAAGVEGEIFPFPDGFSVAEVEGLVKDLQAAKSDFEARSAAAEAVRKRQDVEREELRERRDTLGDLLQEIRLGRTELEREKERFYRDRVRYQTEEQANFKKIAKNYENMDPEEAARAMAKMEEDDVVKILSEMSTRKAGKLMAAMEPDRLARITVKMKGLLRDAPRAKPGKK